MKVYEAIARSLVDNRVGTMFGLIGDANLYMVDHFVREFGGRFVSTAHEAGAVLGAIGYSCVSGGVGVATVTHGPALTNTLTALVEGVRGQAPVLVLCGDTRVEDKDNLQNVAQRELVVATGAGFEQMRSVRTIAEDLATALRRALVERRPVVLNMPVELMWEDVDYRPLVVRLASDRTLVPASSDFDNAIGIVAAARRPLILAGRGAISAAARSALIRLAERIEAPLATTLRAKDLFRGEEYDLGIFGTLSNPVTVEVILEADCILAFGAGLNQYTVSHGTFLEGNRLIQVNAEQRDFRTDVAADAALIGDPALTADHIVDWLDRAEIPPSGFRGPELSARLQGYSPLAGVADLGTATSVDIRFALQFFDGVLAPDRLLVTDLGRFIAETWRLMHVAEPRLFVSPLHFGSIGLGMGHAIGAACAEPGRPTVLVTGDGGFMLGGLTEFNTAVRHGLDLIVLMCNDSAYGMEHIQYRRRQMDPSLSVFDWPDFVSVATALGGSGVTVRSAADFEQAAEAIRRRDRPLLIDIRLDPDAMPEVPH